MFTLNDYHHPHTDKTKNIYMFTLNDCHHPHTDKVKNIYMFTLNDCHNPPFSGNIKIFFTLSVCG
jgi:hypothetical protein